MTAEQMILERRSVRLYRPEPVSRETMDEIMELTRFAPSWSNMQVARCTLISDPEIVARLAREGVKGFSYNIGTLEKAPCACVLSFVAGKSGKFRGDDSYVTSKADSWEVFDAGIACQTFCLAAHAKGVGTCIMGVIDDESISSIVGLPEGETVAALITYGYPAETPEPTPRKSVEQITRYIDKA